MAEKSSQLQGPVELLKESWEVYKNKFVVLVLIVLFTSLPGLVESFTGFSTKNPTTSILAIVFITTMLFAMWSQAALIYAIKEKGLGFVDSLRLGLGKLVPLTFLEILSVLIIVGGFILLIIPGIIFMVWFAFASYVLINEDSSIKGALAKSREYVKGRWWAVFGRLLVMVIFSMLLSIPAMMLGSMGADFISLNLANIAQSALIVPMMTIYMFLLYTNLKSTKDKEVI